MSVNEEFIKRTITRYVNKVVPDISNFFKRKEFALQSSFSKYTTNKRIALFESNHLDVVLLNNFSNYFGKRQANADTQDGAIIEIKYSDESSYILENNCVCLQEAVHEEYIKDIEKIKENSKPDNIFKAKYVNDNRGSTKRFRINNCEGYFILIVEIATNILQIIKDRQNKKKTSIFPVGINRAGKITTDTTVIEHLQSMKDFFLHQDIQRIDSFKSKPLTYRFNGITTVYNVILYKYSAS